MQLVSVIAAEFDEAWYRADLASIVGERTEEDLAAWIDTLCRTQLKQEIVDARFASKSVGAVFGLTLADGMNVVLKLFPTSFSESELRAIERCLAHVVAAGFPATKQLTPLFRAEGLWAAFYELAPGRVLDPHTPEVRTKLARALADFARVMTGIDPSGLPLSPTRRDALWPPAHRIGINLSIPGGEWIDARAEAAQRLIRATHLPLFAAHTDWAASHALFEGERLSAVIDWDSLMQASEAEMVGRAAAEFTLQWSAQGPQGPLTPTRDEAIAFVREYEAARGRRFDTVEQRVISASADYLLAQIGRHGHSGPDCADDEFRRVLRETAVEPLVSFGA